MKGRQPTVTILMADDDDDDSMLIREAIIISKLPIDLHAVSNGEELMDYLCHRGQYADTSLAPRPGLILLDLNMPKKNGIEVLKEIKTDPELRPIPIIVLTTSTAEENIDHTYSLGANSYIVKPMTFSALVELMKTLGKYWFETVELPLAVAGGKNEQKPNQSSAN
ncbi:response regulator receiver protein [Nostoc sp. HK-01]|uniref:Two-component response regulator n=1 Tax=Nostoc cycadae WK-1 TaxID=1861711 RepID=A0A2H6LEL7_9NOSO|nr:response regulator [Nostoc cycadae]BBD60961.1 response regulator receiver protein [Nostoc sp. HK-01]GBE91675.1 two-component response regulator [Nostoc cycadae WK-1]